MTTVYSKRENDFKRISEPKKRSYSSSVVKESTKYQKLEQACFSEPHSLQGKGKLEYVSESLGLKKDFLNRLESMPEYIRCHRGHKGWVLIFIENNYDEIDDQGLKTKLNNEFLRKLGFTNLDVMEKMKTRFEAMQEHLDPIDFVKRFIKDEFKYKVYPLEEEEAKFIPEHIPVLDFASFNAEEQNEPNIVHLFHETDLLSAEDIICNGI